MKSFAELAKLSGDEIKAELLTRAQEAYDLCMSKTGKNKKGENVPCPDINGAMFILGHVARILGVEESRKRVSRKTVADMAADAPWLKKAENDDRAGQ
jgi:hypothetical protein